MKSRTFKAWAIDANSDEGHGFLGRYWNFEDGPVRPPIHLEGCKIALFTTRKIARGMLPKVRRFAFPKAKVVRVTVSIQSAQHL